MIPAIPLAYAARHLYPDDPYAPSAGGSRPLAGEQRRRRGLIARLRLRSATGE